jgi:hypothetical protein
MAGQEAFNFADSCLSAGDKHPRTEVHRCVAETLFPLDDSGAQRPTYTQPPMVVLQSSAHVVEESCAIPASYQTQSPIAPASHADESSENEDVVDEGHSNVVDEGPSNIWDVGMGMFPVIAVNTADFLLQLHTMTARLLSISTGALRLQKPHSCF